MGRAQSWRCARSAERLRRYRGLTQARRWHARVFQALSLMLTPFYQSDSTVMPF
ncbi:MAG: FAD-dependent monooxygenase, partial [Mesorhizobium sp.]